MTREDLRWALVTGSGKKLGRAIATMLASKGYSVVVHYHEDSEAAEETANLCRRFSVQAETLRGDFFTAEGVADFIRRYLEKFATTAVLVNNIGHYLIESILTTSGEDWYRLFQINLHAPFFLIKALMPSLQKMSGSIFNIGMVGVHAIHADLHSSLYILTKTALWGLTKSLAAEVAPVGVRVNMLSPGYLNESVEMPPDIDQLLMHRLGKFQEVADLIAYLLSEQGAYITGQNIEVAGGIRL